MIMVFAIPASCLWSLKKTGLLFVTAKKKKKKKEAATGQTLEPTAPMIDIYTVVVTQTCSYFKATKKN
jgi:hypothetical protein